MVGYRSIQTCRRHLPLNLQLWLQKLDYRAIAFTQRVFVIRNNAILAIPRNREIIIIFAWLNVFQGIRKVLVLRIINHVIALLSLPGRHIQLHIGYRRHRVLSKEAVIPVIENNISFIQYRPAYLWQYIHLHDHALHIHLHEGLPGSDWNIPVIGNILLRRAPVGALADDKANRTAVRCSLDVRDRNAVPNREIHLSIAHAPGSPNPEVPIFIILIRTRIAQLYCFLNKRQNF
ncbi:hypothetical protein D3C77_353900 [compost metagenome]